MKLKIMFAGIDGSGKSACMNVLISRLEAILDIVTIGVDVPTRFYQGGTTPAVHAFGFRIISSMRSVAQRMHLMGIYLPLNFFYKYLLARYVEFIKKFDILMHESDVLLQPIVVLGYHLPVTRRLGIRWKLRMLRAIWGSKKNCLVFFLDTEPAVAMKRLHKRGGDLDAHENRESLEILRSDFEIVLDVAVKSGYDIFRINTNEKPLEKVVDEMQLILNERLVLASHK